MSSAPGPTNSAAFLAARCCHTFFLRFFTRELVRPAHAPHPSAMARRVERFAQLRGLYCESEYRSVDVYVDRKRTRARFTFDRNVLF